MNKQKFFGAVRKAFGSLKQTQVDGFNAILDKWEATGFTDQRWLAYMFATAWHETAKTMQAIREFGLGIKKPYGKIDKVTGKAYYGRGLVQLTWSGNYKKMSKIIYGDSRLYVDPDLALDLKVAVEIMFEGMTTSKSFDGDFTGKSLEDYFNDKRDDPINARRIINGLDRAKLINGYHKTFLNALSASAASPVSL